jgi:PAS domain S-box-containing protein
MLGTIHGDAVLDALWRLPELGLGVIDQDLRFLRVNDALADMNGAPAEAHLGRRIAEVVPGIADSVTPHVRAVLAEGRPVDVLIEGETAAAPGRSRRWSERYLPVLDLHGAPQGVLAIVRELGDAEVLRAELHQRDEQLQLAIEAAALGVWEWDAATGMTRWSGEMERLFGVPTGTFGGTFDSYLSLVHPDDRPAVGEAMRASLQRGEPHRVEHRVMVGDETRWVEGRGAAVRDGLGALVGLRGVALDVTTRKRHEERLESERAVYESLSEVSGALAATRDAAAVAQAIADAARRHCGASWSTVLVDEGTSWVGVAHAGPVEAWEASEGPTAARAAALAAPPRRPVARLDVVGPPEAATDRGVALVAPFGDSGMVLGAVVVGSPGPERSLDHHEQVLAGIAAHGAVALENARLHEAAQRELAARQAALEARDHVARVLQRSLLPPELPDIPGVDLAASYVPLHDDIGGDFYDAFPLGGDRWAVVIGDVQGKGPEAAAVTALARYTLRTAVVADEDPSAALTALNTVLLRNGGYDHRFCTAALASVERRPGGVAVRAGVAGHPPLYVLRHDGRLEEVGPSGPLLGVLDAVAVRSVEFELGPGDTCVLYTDGATDVRHDGVTFGEDRLKDVVAGSRGLPAAAVAACIEAAVVGFQHGDVRDDLAILVLRVPEHAGA